MRVVSDFRSNRFAVRRMSQSHPGIPFGMLLQPGKCFRGISFHGQLWKFFVELAPEMPNPSIGQNDVCIQNLTRDWVGSAGADGGADVVVQPANEIVSHVFRIIFHVCVGALILVTNLNGIQQSDFLKGLVPHHHALTHPAAVTNRGGMLDVEDDRIFNRTGFQLRSSFFQMPAVDESSPNIVLLEFPQIIIAGCEITNALVSLAGPVGWVGFDLADRVMKSFQ